jgi:demethylmenaquinone methyltransferase/2-methoxy-6-polyprenyl-1,4-benzoquinol methylase
MSESVAATLVQQLEYYRARAAEYDEWWFRRGRYDRGADVNALWFADAAEVERAFDSLSLRGRILELAGGTGIWSQKLLRYADELTILDTSAEVLAINEARLRSERVRYIQADVFDWRPSERFDVVFFGFWLSHVPESKFAAFWELVRASLAPQGRVFFIDSQREPTSTASDQPLSDTNVTVRRLNDGRTFAIYKVFYDPLELKRRLARLGWNATVRTTSRYFLYGSCNAADA